MDPDFQTLNDELAKQPGDLRTAIQPAASQPEQLIPTASHEISLMRQDIC